MNRIDLFSTANEIIRAQEASQRHLAMHSFAVSNSVQNFPD